MSWEHLKTLTHEPPESGAEPAWLARLCEALSALPAEGRKGAIAEVARQLAAFRAAGQWTGLLAEGQLTVSRHLALALVAWLPAPLDSTLVPLLRPLLSEKRIPGAVRLDAATVLLQTTGTDSPEAESILRALLARTGKARAVDRLHLLMQRVGKSVLLETLCAQREAQIRMRCPRCRTQLRRPEMAHHLWAEHGLVLEGRKVREPWSLVNDWIEEYHRWENTELLERCRALATRLDGEHGLARIHRLFLQHGIDDDAARQALFAQAHANRASLCPNCYALVPIGSATRLPPLIVAHGRLSGGGYSVDVSERGLIPRLHITNPTAPVYQGKEPGRWLTRRGATLLLTGPPVLLAFGAGLLLTLLSFSSLWPVVLPLAVALVLAAGIQLYWLNMPTALERAVDHAWARLVPHLRMGGSSPAESAFLTGLAEMSVQRGTPAERAQELTRLRREAETAVRTGQVSLRELAIFQRLSIADAATTEELDPVAFLAAQVKRCFVGELPLTYAQELLRADRGLVLSSTDRARLLVLLCDAAFESGLEVRDLLVTAPALAGVVEMNQPEMLAQLRLLWSLRPRKPWRRFGDTRTVFELAVDPADAAEHFSRHPDLLLVDLEPPVVLLTSQGIVFRERTITQLPSPLDIVEVRVGGETQYELLLGKERFAFWHNPTVFRSRLDGWLRFYFQEFQPNVPLVFDWHPPSPPRTLLAQEAAACPECRSLLWTRLGEVGKPVRHGPEESPEPVAQVR